MLLTSAGIVFEKKKTDINESYSETKTCWNRFETAPKQHRNTSHKQKSSSNYFYRILLPYLELLYANVTFPYKLLYLCCYAMSYNVHGSRGTWNICAITLWVFAKLTKRSQELFLTSTQAVTALQRDPERLALLLLSVRFGVTNTTGRA